MTIAVENIKQAARLCGLELDRSELPRFRTDLSVILDHIKRLGKITAAVQAQQSAAGRPPVLRSDKVCRSLSAEEALTNAPSVSEDMFNVPKVI